MRNRITKLHIISCIVSWLISLIGISAIAISRFVYFNNNHWLLFKFVKPYLIYVVLSLCLELFLFVACQILNTVYVSERVNKNKNRFLNIVFFALSHLLGILYFAFLILWTGI